MGSKCFEEICCHSDLDESISRVKDDDELQEDQTAEAQGAKVSDNKAPQVGRGEQIKKIM